MQFSALVLALAASVSASAIAAPKAQPMSVGKTARLVGRSSVCPGIDAPQCCETDVDGVLDLTCSSPSKTPSSKSEFESICAETGLTAECCTLSVDGDGVICNDP